MRDIAVMELLIASGLRISELYELTTDAVNLAENEIRIRGKGNKERIIRKYVIIRICQQLYFSDTLFS